MGEDGPKILTAVMELKTEVGSLKGSNSIVERQVSDIYERLNEGEREGCRLAKDNKSDIRDLIKSMDKRFEKTQEANDKRFKAQQDLIEKHQRVITRIVMWLLLGGGGVAGLAQVTKFFGL